MKKVFGFIGSPLKEKSNTYALTKMCLEHLKDLDPEINYELLTAGHVDLTFCCGCWHCMSQGGCVKDKLDDMGMLREKMLEADFIILGSPVYAMHVTGQMKTFLDRLASWYHILMLRGKAGMTVATTAGLGLEIATDFLTSHMSSLGIKVVGSLEHHGFYPGQLDDPDSAMEKARTTAKEILSYITGEKEISSDERLEQSFQSMKQKVTHGAKYLTGDRAYWDSHNMMQLESFAQLIEQDKNNSCRKR